MCCLQLFAAMSLCLALGEKGYAVPETMVRSGVAGDAVGRAVGRLLLEAKERLGAGAGAGAGLGMHSEALSPPGAPSGISRASDVVRSSMGPCSITPARQSTSPIGETSQCNTLCLSLL